MEKYYSGLKLYTMAKNKAKALAMTNNPAKMEELICKIQEQEGNISCFRKQHECHEISCCWQAACGARMIKED